MRRALRPEDWGGFRWILYASLLAAVMDCNSGATSEGSQDGGPIIREGGLDGGASDVAASDAPPFDDAGLAINGTVLAFDTHRALSDRTVIVGDQQTITDGQGRFALHASSPVYNVTVVDPDRLTISVYLGLGRADPTLSHKSSFEATPATNQAKISGMITGGGPYPLAASDTVGIYFFSPVTTASSYLAGAQLPARSGPSYGPIDVAWDGNSSTDGEVVALGIFAGLADGGAAWWWGQKLLTVAGGQMASTDIVLAQATTTTSSGQVLLPAGFTLTQLQRYYRLPIPGAVVGVGDRESPETAFSDDVPDLTDAPATFCRMAVSAPSGSGFLRTERCGLAPDATDVTITLEAPPTLTSPVPSAGLTPSTTFSWTGFADRIYLLQLEADTPSAAQPNIYVFTSQTSESWPAIGRGLTFPSGTSYEYNVGELGPFADIDTALGPEGLATVIPHESRSSFSPSITLATTP